MAIKKSNKLSTGFDQVFRRQWKYFEQQFEQLMTQYEGEFVGMRNGCVVDHDKDDQALAVRMYDKLGSKRFIIAEVARKPRVYEVPSVELLCDNPVRMTKT